MRTCDKCGKPTDLPTITITEGSEIRVLHLCDQHAKPIRLLFALGRATPSDVPATPPPSKKAHQIIPVD